MENENLDFEDYVNDTAYELMSAVQDAIDNEDVEAVYVDAGIGRDDAYGAPIIHVDIQLDEIIDTTIVVPLKFDSDIVGHVIRLINDENEFSGTNEHGAEFTGTIINHSIDGADLIITIGWE